MGAAPRIPSDTRRRAYDWIITRSGHTPTTGLTAVVARVWSAGFIWFYAEGRCWEFFRSLDNDHYEEITLWVRPTPGNRIGFSGATFATRVIEGRTRAIGVVSHWISGGAS